MARPRKNHNPEDMLDLEELLPVAKEVTLTPVGQVNEAVDIGRPIRTDDDLIDFGQRLASSVADGRLTIPQARVLSDLYSTMATLKMAGRTPGQSTTTVLATLLQMGGSPAPLPAPPPVGRIVDVTSQAGEGPLGVRGGTEGGSL